MKEIISKYLNHTANEEELLKLEAWMDESPENRETLFNMKNSFVLASVLDYVDKENDIKSKQQFKSKKKGKQISFKPFLRYAAVVVGVCLMSVKFYDIIQTNNPGKLQTLSVNDGERAKLTLADGSVIWLNSNSTISYSDNFNKTNRNIKLSGEAFFKVAKNKELPFIVNTHNIDVRAVGTEFNVRSYEDDNSVEVQVVEGKVKVQSDGQDNEYYLTADKMLSFNKTTSLFTQSSFDSTIENWRQGKYLFNNKTMEEIIRQLERIYAVDFIVEDSELLKEIYYGEINMNDPVTEILDIISVNNRFSYTINNKQIIISNKNHSL